MPDYVNPQMVGGWAGALMAIVFAAMFLFEKFKTSRQSSHDEVIRSKDELVKTLGNEVDYQKKLAAEKAAEVITVRNEKHEEANRVNSIVSQKDLKILELTTQVGKLESKTDLSIVVSNQEKQTEALSTMLVILNELAKQMGITAKAL